MDRILRVHLAKLLDGTNELHVGKSAVPKSIVSPCTSYKESVCQSVDTKQTSVPAENAGEQNIGFQPTTGIGTIQMDVVDSRSDYRKKLRSHNRLSSIQQQECDTITLADNSTDKPFAADLSSVEDGDKAFPGDESETVVNKNRDVSSCELQGDFTNVSINRAGHYQFFETLPSTRYTLRRLIILKLMYA